VVETSRLAAAPEGAHDTTAQRQALYLTIRQGYY